MIGGSTMDFGFGEALSLLSSGGRVARAGWNGVGMWVKLFKPSPDNHIEKPYLFMKNARGENVIWTPSQTDILSDDWRVVLLGEEKSAA